jgi:hypothetical protein
MPSLPEGGRLGAVTDLRDHIPDVPEHPPHTDENVGGFAGDIVEEWGRQSFPASDPPSNW